MKRILKEYWIFSLVFVKKILKKHSTNMKIFWNIKRTFKKYTNICTFFECFFNIFLKNIEKKNLVFYKCSFNILNKLWDLAPCVSCANATILSRKPTRHIGNLQPSAAELKKLGIKVRDFASEKTLPPVRTVYFHH